MQFQRYRLCSRVTVFCQRISEWRKQRCQKDITGGLRLWVAWSHEYLEIPVHHRQIERSLRNVGAPKVNHEVLVRLRNTTETVIDLSDKVFIWQRAVNGGKVLVSA